MYLKFHTSLMPKIHNKKTSKDLTRSRVKRQEVFRWGPKHRCAENSQKFRRQLLHDGMEPWAVDWTWPCEGQSRLA